MIGLESLQKWIIKAKVGTPYTATLQITKQRSVILQL